MKIKKIENSANDVMQQRTSIRKYDTLLKIGRDEMSKILQDAMTAPSSLNLQPWRFVVIESDAGKEKIKPYMMFNQQQCETSSAIIAIFGDLESTATAEKIYSSAVDHHLISSDVKDKMVNMIMSYRSNSNSEAIIRSMMLDCGFVAMQIMLSAKNYGYDTNPIGAYMRAEFTEALGLDKDKYLPVLLLSIGKADEVSHDSIRYSVSDITQWF